MGCFNETTSVKINKQKKDLAKSKGIESLKIQKEKAMRDCQKKIDILISGLIEFKEEEAAQYDRKIRQLELEKEYNKQMLYKD